MPFSYTREVLNLHENLLKQTDAASHKVDSSKRFIAYLVAAGLAGMFIGLADVFMMTASAPLYLSNSAWTTLVQGGVFGIGLILVVFAGGELATSAMMILPIGMVRQKIKASQAFITFMMMIIGNFLGSLLTAAIVIGSGIMAADTKVGKMLEVVIAGKAHKANSELFFRAILCNILVCIAIWSVGRITNEMAQLVVMAWAMAAFVTSGFEHVVANMTTFMLGVLHKVDIATWSEVGRNLSIVLLGNIVGGAIFIGGSYLLVAKSKTS